MRRRWHLWRDVYQVCDPRDRVRFEIRGPLLRLPFVSHTYRISRDGVVVGEAAKQWGGVLQEYFTDADAFRARVDRNLAPIDKLLLFAAVVLIDFGRYERNPDSS